MYTVGDFYDAINNFAPFSLAESWDNVGLLLGSRETEVSKAIIALDVTSKVIKEAQDLGANLIITHHPIIFSALTEISADSLVYKLIQNGISVISAHTNYDIASGGVNDALAKRIGLKSLEHLEVTQNNPYYKITVFVPITDSEKVYSAMSAAGAGKYENYSGAGFTIDGTGRFLPGAGAAPAIGSIGKLEKVEETRLEMIVAPQNLDAVISSLKDAHPYEEPGYDIMKTYALTKVESLGRIGELEKPMSCKEFAKHISKVLNTTGVRYNDTGKKIRTVGVCGGNGGDFIRTAKVKGADAFVSGEIKHNFLLDAVELDICAVNAGHFATENVFMQPLEDSLVKFLPKAKILQSQKCTDGVLSV